MSGEWQKSQRSRKHVRLLHQQAMDAFEKNQVVGAVFSNG